MFRTGPELHGYPQNKVKFIASDLGSDFHLWKLISLLLHISHWVLVKIVPKSSFVKFRENVWCLISQNNLTFLPKASIIFKGWKSSIWILEFCSTVVFEPYLLVFGLILSLTQAGKSSNTLRNNIQTWPLKPCDEAWQGWCIPFIPALGRQK